MRRAKIWMKPLKKNARQAWTSRAKQDGSELQAELAVEIVLSSVGNGTLIRVGVCSSIQGSSHTPDGLLADRNHFDAVNDQQAVMSSRGFRDASAPRTADTRNECLVRDTVEDLI